jgi:hypothetical protein
MSYRDDREALHHRVAKLEEELKDARREGQEEGRDEAQKRAVVLEEKIGEMKDELERMELELQAMRGAAPPPSQQAIKGPAVFAIFIVGLAVASGVLFMVLRSRPPPPAPVVVTQPTTTFGRAKETDPAQAATPSPVETATPPEPIAPPRSTTARWTAKVTKADGLAIPGGTCTLEAAIITSDATNAIVQDFSINCGGQKLYSKRDKLEGMAQMSNDARELLGPSDDKSTFTLVYRDIGTRSGERAQVDLDTNAKQGSVWRDTIPRFKVDLAIPPQSAAGTPLSTADQRLKRTGKITEVSGAGALKTGATCTLRAMPNGKGKDCSAEVACGATVLWPQSLATSCTYEGSRPLTVSSKADDASLAIDGSTLTLKTKTTSATIALDDK